MSTILQFFPEWLDVNGDAQNALVLAQRARWAGLPVELVTIALGDAVRSERPAAVVIGSSVDSALRLAREAFMPWEGALRDWAAAGVPMLGVGTGFELLSDGIELRAGGESLEGLGLLPGRAVPLPGRAVGELVVDSADGRLIGFENHARGFVPAADTPALGDVVSGIGNSGRSEGARVGSVVGTHLHGPVLAKNPALADTLLTAAFGDAYASDDPRIRFVDEIARTARELMATRLGVGPISERRYSES